MKTKVTTIILQLILMFLFATETQAQYDINFWLSLSKRSKALEQQPDYKEFSMESSFSDQATPNFDWNVTSIR